MFGIFKSKKVLIQNPSEFIEIMEKISQILHDEKFYGQAKAFSEPIKYLKLNDIENFLKHFNTVDIWGGSGAAWEVGGFSSWKVEKQFLINFRKLIELMHNSEIKNRKAQSVGKFFLERLEQKE